MRGRLFRIPMLCIALWLSAPASGFAADGDHDRAAQLKAAYLFNFVKFVQWPDARPEDTVTVCFIGRTRVQRALADSSEGKKAGGRTLAVRGIEPSQGTEGCSMLYIDAEAARSASKLPVPESAVPVLTVSDSKGFARAGGMIELFSDSNRLHFSINVDTARRAGLNVSSSLLQLAASVEKTGAP